MPAARDQPAKGTLERALGVDMDVLRVEAPGEFDDLVLGDRDLPVLEDGARHVILEIAVFDRHGNLGRAQRHLALDPAIADCITSTLQKSRGWPREGGR